MVIKQFLIRVWRIFIIRIAITYDKETKRVFQHFGRTEYFYIFDTEIDEKKVFDNGGYSHHDLAPYLKSLI